MSITAALERIERWAAQNDPQFVSLLQPGLTRQAIDALVSGLPFSLAEEVYELYQWHNGQQFSEFRFGMLESHMYPFMPFTEALDEYNQFQAENYSQEVEGGSCQFPDAGGWFPILGMERYFKASLGTSVGEPTSPIVGLTRDGNAYLAYASLKVILEFQSDLYESGAMRHDEETDEDFADYRLKSKLKRQHFPEAVSQAEEDYALLGQPDSEWVRERV